MSSPGASTLQVRIESGPPVPVVAVSGSASMSETDRLRVELERIAAQKPPSIVLDLSELEFVCSQGLGVLITVQGKLREHGGQLRLAGVRPPIRKVLEVTRLTRMFELYETRQEALDA
jgi:anti-anti-sigma factor